MALVPVTLELLRGAFGSREKAGRGSHRVLSLGYSDLLASQLQLPTLFGDGCACRLEYCDDSEQILRWHNVLTTDRVADTCSVFGALGFDVIDFVEDRGGESVHDLSTPVPAVLRERYRANPSQLA